MLNPEHLIASGGLLLIAFMIFSESGMMLDFSSLAIRCA